MFAFTNSWEQRKYEDLGDSSSGGNLNYDCLDENGEYKCVLYGELYTRYDCVIKDVFYRTNKKGNTIFKNDILFPQSTTVDALSLISPACLNDETAETSGVFVVRPKKDIDGNFVAYYTKGNPNQRSKLSKKAQGLTIVHLYYQSIKDEQICIPSYSEQKQISSLFLKLDNLITLHQRKFYWLKKKKNAKNKISTNSWEQRNITELGKIFIGLVTTMTKHYTTKGTLLIRNSDIKDNKFEFGSNPIYLEKHFAELNASRMHEIGDVITVHTGDVGTSAVISKKEDKSIGFATIVTRPYQEKIHSEYLSAFLNTDKHKKFAVQISTGDGRTNYNLGDYYNLNVPVPSLEEQDKISEFIKNINNLITLHQRNNSKTFLTEILQC